MERNLINMESFDKMFEELEALQEDYNEVDQPIPCLQFNFDCADGECWFDVLSDCNESKRYHSDSILQVNATWSDDYSILLDSYKNAIGEKKMLDNEF